MATKSPARPRSVAGRHRPVYHEVQPGGTSRGNAPRDSVTDIVDHIKRPVRNVE